MHFIDEAEIEVRAGHGGNGCTAFRREKFVPRGGPSGGDGGHGGDVVVVGRQNLNTLHHLRHKPLFRAERGRHGEGSNKTGRSGEDLEIPMPLGTVLRDAETGALIGELLDEGQRLVVARGGRGGRGNARFATATRRAPRHSEPGREGQEGRIRLELKLLADVGVVGLPNAGKSTLISALTAARPKIADYPFTTLVPQLGVVAPEGSDPFVMADLPGLIAGAGHGAGLGFQFLRHIERCRILVHLVDLASEQSVLSQLLTIERELEAFDPTLLARPRLLVGSKSDAAIDERIQELAEAARVRELPSFVISSVARQGLEELVGALVERLSELRLETPSAEAGPEIEPGPALMSEAEGPGDECG